MSNIALVPFKIEQDLVCHSSMMDICKIKSYSHDGQQAVIYSAVALWGKKYSTSVLVTELRSASDQERQTGFRMLEGVNV